MEPNLHEVVESAKASMKELKRAGLNKPEPINRFYRRMAEEAGTYPLPCLAVDVCVNSYVQFMQELKEEGDKKSGDLTLAARISYCNHLPKLTDSDSICDFIACVVHGMAIGILPGPDGTRLLYGAQVAQAAQPSPKRHKKHNKSTQKQAGNQAPTQNESTT